VFVDVNAWPMEDTGDGVDGRGLFPRHLQAGLLGGGVLVSGVRAAADEATTRDEHQGDPHTPPAREPGAVLHLEESETAQVARVRANLAFHPNRLALSENAKVMSLQVCPPREELAASHTR